MGLQYYNYSKVKTKDYHKKLIWISEQETVAFGKKLKTKDYQLLVQLQWDKLILVQTVACLWKEKIGEERKSESVLSKEQRQTWRFHSTQHQLEEIGRKG